MNRDDELDILCRMLDALKLDDVVLSYNKDGVLQADDSEGNRWSGADFYKFLTNECLCFDDDGSLSEGQYVEAALLERYTELTAVYGVPAGKYGRMSGSVSYCRIRTECCRHGQSFLFQKYLG